MNCKEIGNVGGQMVRCDLPEGHEGNHHAVVEATREMQLETERDAVTDRLAAVIVEAATELLRDLEWNRPNPRPLDDLRDALRTYHGTDGVRAPSLPGVL